MDIIKVTITAACVFLTAACASTNSVEMSNSQRETIMKTASELLKKCMVDNVASYDDGVTDASYIALALAGRCSSEYNYFTDTYLSTINANDQVKRNVKQVSLTDDRKIKTFLPMVLKFRSYVREG
ncbi:hypothetical protein [Serratia ficaria]|uniref:hypothetical protein n=1 Tax=Serratia ficaria TaxID=61651 RepID=UPI0021C83C1F|nr:hypothetical protein [Serratia ficaria]